MIVGEPIGAADAPAAPEVRAARGERRRHEPAARRRRSRGARRGRRGRRLVGADPDEEGASGPADLGAGAAAPPRPRSSAPSSRTRRRWACGAARSSASCSARSFAKVATPYGPVRVKLAALDGEVLGAQPEFEDCRRLAAAGRRSRRARCWPPRPPPRGRCFPDGRGGRARERRRGAAGARRPGKAAQVLAVGTGESQLHAATEHVARRARRRVGQPARRCCRIPRPSTWSRTATRSTIGRVAAAARSVSARAPRARGGRGDDHRRRRAASAGPSEVVGVVFPVIIGRKPAGALVARFAGEGAAAAGGDRGRPGADGRVAARHGPARRQGARADPRAHPARHAPRRPRGAPGARHRALPRLHRQRLRRHRRASTARAWSST